MKALKYFQRKEALIEKAIERVNIILTEFEQGKRDPENWNNTHDLKTRLEDRHRCNWSDFKDWHFEKYQFNTYEL